jgi:hypothetical protein
MKKEKGVYKVRQERSQRALKSRLPFAGAGATNPDEDFHLGKLVLPVNHVDLPKRYRR